jgi:hypothetical protein
MRFAASSLLLLAALAASPAHAEQDASVGKKLDQLELKYDVDKDGDYKITMDMGSNRTQLVLVRSAIEDYNGMRIREVWSPGYSGDGPIPGNIANRLLEHSNQVKLGGWVNMDGMGVFVVKLPADASAGDLGLAIAMSAKSADKMEEELTGSKDAL